MIAALFDPFRTLATLLIGLLPVDAGSQAVGIATLLAICLVVLAIAVPVCLLGAYLERDRRTA